MTNLVLESLRQLVADLESLRAQWALIGGHAVSARVEPRFTRDVDISVLVPDDEAAERVVSQLTSRGYLLDSIVEQVERGRLATVRLLSPVGGGVLVDLLFASSGIEAEVVDSAEVLEIMPSLSVPVARAGHLVVLKLLARDDALRPQDAIDLIALRAVLTPAETTDVRRLAQLVQDRGYHRERDLVGLAEEYLGGG
ncbi:MAG: nucleotidyl transferase AbiEii/AbiGii toxin family protein [Actinomycetales bacterium]